jgi:hypothetical protein
MTMSLNNDEEKNMAFEWPESRSENECDFVTGKKSSDGVEAKHPPSFVTGLYAPSGQTNTLSSPSLFAFVRASFTCIATASTSFSALSLSGRFTSFISSVSRYQ